MCLLVPCRGQQEGKRRSEVGKTPTETTKVVFWTFLETHVRKHTDCGILMSKMPWGLGRQMVPGKADGHGIK